MEQDKGPASQLRTRIGRLEVREAGSISRAQVAAANDVAAGVVLCFGYLLQWNNNAQFVIESHCII